MAYEIIADGTEGPPVRIKAPEPRSKGLTGPPVLLRRLRVAEKALARASKVERRTRARVYAVMAAIEKANRPPDRQELGTYSYSVRFVTAGEANP